MNKKQIKAELRRSAVDDKSPWHDVDIEAFEFVSHAWLQGLEAMFNARPNDLRTLFLLVAEAM